jgi:candicidin polyketide synthase FscE
VLAQTAYTQPALFALEYALYHLWQSWGVQPAVVMGHSVGEYVAACVAGVFSLEDGLKLIATRGRLMQQMPAGGTMVSLMASEERVKAFIGHQAEVAIAAINGPESTVISGLAAAVQAIAALLESEGVKTKALQVSHGFHSPLMEPIVAEFAQIAQQVNYSLPRLKLVSNVTGQIATQEIATPEYWCQHILSPVNFAAGMQSLYQQDCQVFLECGAKPILLGMGRQCLPENIGVWLPSLRPGQADWQQLLNSLGELYVRGVKIDWQRFDQDYSQRKKVILPTYPFQRQRYWVDISHKPNISHDQAFTEPSQQFVHRGTSELAAALNHRPNNPTRPSAREVSPQDSGTVIEIWEEIEL